MNLLKNVYPGLKTTYHIPHICGNCMEHIDTDWNFYPKCGTPTGLTASDLEKGEEYSEVNRDKP